MSQHVVNKHMLDKHHLLLSFFMPLDFTYLIDDHVCFTRICYYPDFINKLPIHYSANTSSSHVA